MGWFSSKKDDDDRQDDRQDDRPVAPWQNVSQDEVPVTQVTCDEDTDTWETPGSTLIQTWPFVDQGDD